MAYATIADITNQLDDAILIQLTDDANTGEYSEAVVARAIEDADSEIDGYVGSRYRVPMNPVPPVLRKLSADIAIYNLYSRRQGAPEHRDRRYQDAIRFLESVAKGDVSLGAYDPEGNPPANDAPMLSGDNPRREFSRHTLKDY